MSSDRPNPDELLARVQAEEARQRRGKLRIFFGYAAGVGKTYAMLLSARREHAEGREVVVGYVEPHGRAETEALLEGLEVVPTLQVPYRGVMVREFDLDAALVRNPDLILVDELAHTNAPDMRHVKRWQDVEELLDAGINVWTTLNVQHIESLNDVVAQITQVIVRETIPDHVFLEADDVELIDLTPDELLDRLREGKVYLPAQAQRAIQHFFQKGNLAALRELSLRRTADRINVDVQSARQEMAGRRTWPTNERLLVCVGPSPTSAKVVRAAKRLADRLSAEWIAVSVKTPQSERMSDEVRLSLNDNIRLAERLGAETIELAGEDIVEAVLDYAGKRNVSKIIVGKTGQPKRRMFQRESLVDRIVRFSGDVDVYVVRGVGEPTQADATRYSQKARRNSMAWWGTGLILAFCTAIAWGINALGFTEANLVMTYLLGVVVTATRFGAKPSIAAAILAVLLFDFFFTEPYFSVTVHDTQYVVTFAVMLIVGLISSSLAARMQYLAAVSRQNWWQTEALYRLSRELIGIADTRQLVEQAERTVSEVFDSHAVIFLADGQNRIRPLIGHLSTFAASATEIAAAQWVIDRKQVAGLGTDTLPSSKAFYLPLATQEDVVGALAVQPELPSRVQSLEARHLLETFATQIAFAIKQNRLAEQSQQTRLEMETERLRSSLLSSVSHDLRTPLSIIAGASSSLLGSPELCLNESQRDLLETISTESSRLSRLVENLLHMTRLEAGTLLVHKEWHLLEEIIGSSLNRVSEQITGRNIETELPADLVMVPVDAVLIEQVLINLLENAARYSPEQSPIQIRASRQDRQVTVEVADRGPGIAAGEEQRIFEKFYRGQTAKKSSTRRRIGAVNLPGHCRAHGGRIWAENVPDGGAIVRLTLPLEGEPPHVLFDSEPSEAEE